MEKNVGNIDKAIRVVLGLVIIAVGFFYSSWLGAIGIIPLFTALVGWCPLYSPLKINTCSKSCENK